MKSILFFSFYGHQARFFTKIIDNFKKRNKNYNLYHINVYKSIFNRFFYNCNIFTKNKAKQLFSDKEIEQIISFSFAKQTVNSTFFSNKLIKELYKKILKIQVYGYIKYFYYYFKKNKIELLIVWNGLHHPLAAATELAKKMNIKTIFMENGYMPSTISVDSAGVNYYSSLTGKGSDFYKKVSIQKEKLDKLYDSIKSKSIREQMPNLPKNYIFLPLQVHDDTQILIHSPQIKKMEDFIRKVYTAIEKVNERENKNYYLVLKEHPQDIGRIGYDDIYKEYEGKKFVVIKQGNIHQILKDSQLVITINSTVGIEALIYHKPVIILGNAFYNIKGITYSLQDFDDLSTAISYALKNELNHELIDKFLYFLRYEYLVESGKNNNSKDENQVVDRIIDIVEGKKYRWMQ